MKEPFMLPVPGSALHASMTRRAFFGRSAGGVGIAALAFLLGRRSASAEASLDRGAPGEPGRGLPGLPHFAPRARRVIHLFMSGGPSQIDLLDPKPKLVELNGKPMPESFTKGQRVAQLMGQELRCVGSKFRFEKRGKCGADVSELLPHTARIVDEIAIIRSMHTDAINHDPAVTLFQTGGQQPGRPSIGAWASYGLGCDTDQLPAFVVLTSGRGLDQPLVARYWGSGFLPSSYQGVEFRSEGEPILFVENPRGMDRATRRRMLDGLGDLNRLKLRTVHDPEIETRIQAFEMAFRMQGSVPELMDLRKEPPAVLERYGAVPGGSDSFANNCLLARRLVERGVRFVQVYHRGWDQHGNLPAELTRQCLATDRACAALVEDLKERGLLDDTLVVWTGEFGRTPMNQGDTSNGNYGRDHHMKAFATWLAGGGIRGGITVGETDELGYNPISDPVHINDLQATLLHCLGIDHEKLTYRFQGRDFRLTDVGGVVVEKLLA